MSRSPIMHVASMAVAVALSTTACSPSTTRVSPVVESSGGAWKRAWVERNKQPAGLRASDMGPRWSNAVEAYNLVVCKPDGTEFRTTLRGKSQGAPDYAIVFAPDTHALLISDDGRKTWFYVALDAGDTPALFSSIPLAWSGTWSQGESTRAIVLRVLKTLRPKGVGLSGIDDATVDYRQSLWFAGEHATTDPELRGLYLEAYGEMNSASRDGSTNYQMEGYHKQIAVIARADQDTRRQLFTWLAGDKYVGAAAALSYVPMPEVADALAADLRRELQSTERPMNRQRVLWETWALARLGTELGLSSEHAGVLSSVISAARSGGREGSVLVRVEDATAGRLAVLGIARVARTEPQVRLQLDKLAAQPCRLLRTVTAEVVQQDPPLPPIQDIGDLVREEASREYDQRYEVSCWARATLASMSKPAAK